MALFFFGLHAAFGQTSTEITALVTITNAAKITNAQSTFTVNGVTRTWTNQTGFNPSSSIAFTNDGFQATTNLLNAYRVYGASGAAGPVYCKTNGGATNAFVLVSSANDTLTVTFTPNYCTVSFSTSYYTNGMQVKQPFTGEQPNVRTNIASLLLATLRDYPSNSWPEAITALLNYVSVTNSQTIGNKTLTNFNFKGGIETNVEIRKAIVSGGSTNGVYTNAIGKILFARGNTDGGAGETNSYLAPTTNGAVGLYYNDGTSYLLGDVWPLEDPQLVNWGSLRTIAPVLNISYRENNLWALPQTYSYPYTNKFDGLLMATNGARLQGGQSPLTMTNAAGAFSGLTATNLAAPWAAVTILTNDYWVMDSHGLRLYDPDYSPTIPLYSLWIPGDQTLLETNKATVYQKGSVIFTNGPSIVNGVIGNPGANNLGVVNATNLQAFSGQASNTAVISFTETNGIHGGTNLWPGDISFTPRTSAVLANLPSHNPDIVLGTNVYVRLSGGSAVCTLDGFVAERDGSWHIVEVTGSVTNIISNQSGNDGVTANRTITGTGADIQSTNNPTVFLLHYNGSLTRWIIESLR